MESVVLMCVLLVPGREYNLDELVAAHESAVGLVRAIDMTIDVHRLSKNGKRDVPPLHNYTLRWSMEGELERQQYRNHAGQITNSRGEPTNLGDLFQDGTTTKIMLNWDPEDPQPINPHQQGTLNCWYEPQGTGPAAGGFYHPREQFAMFRIQTQTRDRRRTLSEIVSASPRVSLEGSTRVGILDTQKIVIDHPESAPGGAFAGVVIEVFLDPSVNFLIRKMVIRHQDGATTGDLIIVREVNEFADYGDGVFVPIEMIFTMYAPEVFDGPTYESRWVARDVTVNAELPADTFSFRFPDQALVKVEPPIDGRRTVYLWGPDGLPLREINGFMDLGPIPGSGSAFFVSFGLTLLLLLVAVFVIRWRWTTSTV
jgi:hypothetical protein